MKKAVVMVLGTCVATVLSAGPVMKIDPVAPGYPNWHGVSTKTYLAGREIEPSDLRHKVTIVVETTLGEKWNATIKPLAKFVEQTGLTPMFGHTGNWDEIEVPRNVIVLVNVHGAKAETMREALQPKAEKGKEIGQETSQLYALLNSRGCSYYDGVTFTGAPDNEGKFPYVYVMGPTGTEPLFKGALDDAGQKGVFAAIVKGKKEIAGWNQKWQPFYGNIEEPKFNTSLKKTLDKGKAAKKAPLGPIEKSLLADIKAKDEEKAKEAQILYDALVQTRSDLVLRIMLEAGASPHRAYYDVNLLLKHWPMMAKKLEAAVARIKAVPEVEMLGKVYTKLMTWSDPEFDCKPAEAKKIVVELNKIKKALSAAKESKNIVVQNGALLMDGKLDDLISLFQTKVDAK